MAGSLVQQITAAPGQPSSVRIGLITSVSPITVTVQGAVFTNVGFLRNYALAVGDNVALLGQSSQAGSDPTSWLCLGAVDTSPMGIRAREVAISFASATSNVQNVSFVQPFPAGVIPNVHVNINTGAGVTSQWHVRAINITNVGFDLFSFSGVGAAAAWVAVPVGVTAVARTA